VIPGVIETSRGLLMALLRATGRPVYAINPVAAARYRDRHAVTRKKSDHLDAMVLADILRTDKAAHRPPPAGELARAIAVLARAQQDAVWDRTQAGNCGRRPRSRSPCASSSLGSAAAIVPFFNRALLRDGVPAELLGRFLTSVDRAAAEGRFLFVFTMWICVGRVAGH
jgi:hypothetical protein